MDAHEFPAHERIHGGLHDRDHESAEGIAHGHETPHVAAVGERLDPSCAHGAAEHAVDLLERGLTRTLSLIGAPALGERAQRRAHPPRLDQRRRSRYMLLFRTPWLPETLFCFNGLSLLDRAVWPEHGAAARTEYHAVFSEPRALGAALDWYRAASLDPGPGDVRVGVPALVIWGNRDPAVGRASFEGEKALFTGPLTEVELDAGHWLMETHAPLVTATVLRHIEGI
jgi:pimeloyl-ACP methyl ester carboxylesterase